MTPARGPSSFAPGSEPDWDRIAAAYEAGGETVDAICARFGIARSLLYRRARLGGWAKRKTDGTGTGTRNRPTRDRIARLYAALDRQMEDVERRLAAAQGTGASAAGDRERDARTLATLARTLEKLNAMAPPPDKEADDRPPDDIDEFRRELARRLEALRRRGDD